MSVALLCLSSILALAWLPILIKFFRNWRGRANPISLAICFIIAFAIYICIVPFFETQDPLVMALVVQIVNAVTCLFFHISFGWAKKRWTPDGQTTRSGTIPATTTKRGSRTTDYPASVENGTGKH